MVPEGVCTGLMLSHRISRPVVEFRNSSSHPSPRPGEGGLSGYDARFVILARHLGPWKNLPN
jgi:hypothetical protein